MRIDSILIRPSDLVSANCIHCGKEFVRVWSVLRKSLPNVYCGRQCFGLSRRNTPEVFWSRVDKSQPEYCWIWKGRLWNNTPARAYGHFDIKGVGVFAHRMAYELTYGPIPKGLEVCHKCDNPPCVRPDHLFLGTHTDNMRDAVAKGKLGHVPWSKEHPYPIRGEKSPNARLTDAKVLEMKMLYARGGVSQRSLGKKMGISSTVARRVLSGKGWTHIQLDVSTQ